ncbi:hypothetical protein ACLOJK_039773 [Asimina triloba]
MKEKSRSVGRIFLLLNFEGVLPLPPAAILGLSLPPVGKEGEAVAERPLPRSAAGHHVVIAAPICLLPEDLGKGEDDGEALPSGRSPAMGYRSGKMDKEGKSARFRIRREMPRLSLKWVSDLSRGESPLTMVATV